MNETIFDFVGSYYIGGCDHPAKEVHSDGN